MESLVQFPAQIRGTEIIPSPLEFSSRLKKSFQKSNSESAFSCFGSNFGRSFIKIKPNFGQKIGVKK